MINELFGNYVNVLGFRIIMILVFIVTVIDLLVRANHINRYDFSDSIICEKY